MDPRDLIEQAMRTIRERQAQSAAITEQIKQIRGKAQSEDERIKVEVGAMGQLESIELNPRAMKLPSDELAKTIVDLAHQAAEDAAAQTRKAMEPMLGEGVDWQRMVDDAGNLDMSSFGRAAESLGLRIDDPEPAEMPGNDPDPKGRATPRAAG
jgi:DNA-binding protein YbaB